MTGILRHGSRRLLLVAGVVVSAIGSATGCSSSVDDVSEQASGELAVLERIGPAPTAPEPTTTRTPGSSTTTTLPPATTAATPSSSSVVPSTTGLPATTAPASTTTRPTAPDRAFTVARPTGGDLHTYRAPDDPEVWWRLPNPGPYEGDRVVLVLEDHGDWLHVDLPVRPNGTTGWVRRSDVTLSSHVALVRVDLSERRLWAWEDGHLVAEGAVALGTSDTPTPTGQFYVNEIQEQVDPDTIFGSWIVGTSGFSDVLDSAFGGDPAVAIHGTNDPTVLGLEASLGYVRVHDDVVARLARLPLGTPVEIVA